MSEQDARDAARYRALMNKAEIIRVTSGQMLCLPFIRLYESIHGPDFREDHDAAVDHYLAAPEKNT